MVHIFAQSPHGRAIWSKCGEFSSKCGFSALKTRWVLRAKWEESSPSSDMVLSHHVGCGPHYHVVLCLTLRASKFAGLINGTPLRDHMVD